MIRTSSRPRRTGRPALDAHPDAHLEPLEPRSLFSAPFDFAGVGIRFDPAAGPAAFQMVGQLGADNAVTGTSVFAGASGAPVSGPIDFATFEVLSQGRMNITLRDGLDPYAEQIGTHFVRDRGYPLGSFYGVHEGADAPTDIAFFAERPTVPITWVGTDRYQFQYFEISSEGTSIISGEFFYSPAGNISWSNSSDGSDATIIGVDEQDADGTLHLENGVTIFATPGGFPGSFENGIQYFAGNVALIVDTDNSDGRVGVGIARRYTDVFSFGNEVGLQGAYRANILTTGPIGQEFFGSHAVAPNGVASARVVIDVDYRGQYNIYDMAAYDAGDRTVLSSGTWDAPDQYVADRGFTLQLTNEDGARATFMISYFDYALVAFQVESDAGTEQLIGSAAAYSGYSEELYTRGGHVALDDNGRPIFYQTIEHVQNDPRTRDWYSVDLIDMWGGEPLVAVDSINYRSDNPVFIVLGVAQDGDVHVWERGYTNRWIHRNLSEELGGERLVSDITIFEKNITPNTYPSLAIAGKNADGDLAIYDANLEFESELTQTAHTWTTTNVTDTYLTPFGETTPVWTGPIQGYTTVWGAINIVGLNVEGEIEVAWTAPGLAQWFVNNLSQTAGTPPLVGQVSIFVTPWSGIHIHALDEQGELHVTWWVPQFGGEWQHNNLTTETGGPALDPTRFTDRGRAFTTFISATQTLNIAGFDSNGRLRVYWWSAATNAWNVGDITDSFGVENAPFTLASADTLGDQDPYFHSGQSLYGYNKDGSFSRMWWATGGPDLWHVENLTELAIPILN